MQDYKNKINIVENNTGYNVIKPVKQKYCFNCLTLRKYWKKKLTMNCPPPILPIHGKGVKINVKIQDDQRKAN